MRTAVAARGRLGPKETAMAGLAAVAALCSWLTLRPGAQSLVTDGFDMSLSPARSGPLVAAPPAASSLNPAVKGAFTRPVGEAPSAVLVQAAPAPSPVGAAGPIASASGEPAVAAAPQDAAKLGVPLDREGLRGAGAKRGLIEAMADTLIAHPKVLRFVLNNKTFLDAYFGRQPKLCRDPGALKAYLSDGADPGGVSQELSLLQKVVANPAAARVAAESDAAQRVLDCPSAAALVSDGAATASILASNASLLPFLSNQTALSLAAENAKASGMLEKVQSVQLGL